MNRNAPCGCTYHMVAGVCVAFVDCESHGGNLGGNWREVP